MTAGLWYLHTKRLSFIFVTDNSRTMAKLTVNIEDKAAERKVRELLDQLRLNYSIDIENVTDEWWEDEQLVLELDRRSEELKTGRDKGTSFSDVKQRLLSK